MNILKYFAVWKLPPRINRTQYGAINIVYIITVPIAIFVSALLTVLIENYTSSTIATLSLLILKVPFIAFYIFLFISTYLLMIKRLHDINLSGWHLAICILLIIGIKLQKYLMPAANTTLKFVGLVVLVV